MRKTENKKEDIVDATDGGNYNVIENAEGILEFVPKEDESQVLFNHELVESRKPILDKESAEKFNFDAIDREWVVLTETIRRNMLENPETRKVVASYAKNPVSELLPYDFLLRTSLQDDSIFRLIDKYKDSMMDYLSLPAVPDQQITPDITHAKGLRTPKDVMGILKSAYDESYYQETLKRYIDSGFFNEGVTYQEKKMITQRYRFARDIKMLAFVADSFEQKDTLLTGESKEITLPSGIKIDLNTENRAEIVDLTNPSKWLKRKQLKDRVYELAIGESSYLLKEKKTSRHTDTKRHGHQDGLTSLQEFKTAAHFKEHAVFEEGDIKIDWEEPLACVVFPDEVTLPDKADKKDSFQFTVFKYESGLVEQKLIIEKLAGEILSHREQFEKEFEGIRQLSKRYIKDQRVLAFEGSQKKKKIEEFTFEDYAMIKALKMTRQAKHLLSQTITKNGYVNSDQDGYSYKINIKNNKLQLEILGFDFEYFSKITEGQQEIDRRLEWGRDFEKEFEDRGIGFIQWNNEKSVSRIQKAAYLALVELENKEKI